MHFLEHCHIASKKFFVFVTFIGSEHGKTGTYHARSTDFTFTLETSWSESALHSRETGWGRVG
jgi:hypothetical protein